MLVDLHGCEQQQRTTHRARGQQREAGERAACAGGRRRPERVKHLGGGLVHHGAFHAVLAAGIGAEQGTVTQQVDAPGHTGRERVNPAQGVAREGQGPVQSGHIHAVLDVLPGLGLVECVEVKARDHALCELLQFGLGQQVAQFGLADQDDLQQLAGVGLQVGEQAQLFQHVGRQVLCFIDDEHGVLSCGVGGQQKSVEWVNMVFSGGLTRTLVVHHHPKLVTDRAQQLDDRELGVEDVSDPAVLGGLLQKAAADGGLAGTDLASQQHKTTATLHAVQQMGERLPVAFAH
ncbi:hypothetical protein FQZ97_776040 [compost metagenome]